MVLLKGWTPSIEALSGRLPQVSQFLICEMRISPELPHLQKKRKIEISPQLVREVY